MKFSLSFSLFFLLFVSCSWSIYAKVLEITEAQELNELFASGIPAIINFSIAGCPPCILCKPGFYEVSEDTVFDHIAFVSIDSQSEAGKALFKQHKIVGSPTFICIQNGQEIKRAVGISKLKYFTKNLKELLKTAFNIQAITTDILEKEQPLDTHIDYVEMEHLHHTIESDGMEAKEVTTEKKVKQPGFMVRLWFVLHAVFSFFIEKIKDLLTYIINLIRTIVGKK